MQDCVRSYPQFSLCGLNCGLCPRYHTEGDSRCPGCGGPGFRLKHPACAVISCNKKHDDVEFCFQCSAYPCGKYAKPEAADSFISYRNIARDFQDAQKDLDSYKKNLERKTVILRYLLDTHDNGRRKNYYCQAVNLLDLEFLEDLVGIIQKDIEPLRIDVNAKSSLIVQLIESQAKKTGLELGLRKKNTPPDGEQV